MGLEEEWRTSKVSFAELVFRPVIHSGYTVRDMGSKKAVGQVVLGAEINKAIFAIFTASGALFPFLLYSTLTERNQELETLVKGLTTRTTIVPLSLAVTISLGLLLVFGYVVLYCVQVLPSFVSTGAFAPVTLLPIESRSVSHIAALTLWRTLDYIFVVSFLSLVATAAYFTRSILAATLVGLADIFGFLLAVGLALWLTAVFQRRAESRGASGLRGLTKPLSFILWGLGVMSAVFIFSLVSYVAPFIQNALSSPDSPSGILLPLLLPFSAGIVASHLQGQAFPELTLLLGLVGLTAGGIVAAASSRAILGALGAVIAPPAGMGAQRSAEGFSFKVRGALGGYVLKDLRVATRNPATGFLFALPLFDVLAVALPILAAPEIRMSAVLTGVQVGGGFALFAAFLLVTVEDFGVERRTALPFNEGVRTLSKTLVSTICYLPIPLSLGLGPLFKTSTFPTGSFVVPILGVACVFAGCIVEVTVIRALAEGGHGTAVRFAAGVGSGEATMLLPSVAYAASFVLAHDHLEALLLFVFLTLVELGVAAAWALLQIMQLKVRQAS
jgi:predicted permease